MTQPDYKPLPHYLDPNTPFGEPDGQLQQAAPEVTMPPEDSEYVGLAILRPRDESAPAEQQPDENNAAGKQPEESDEYVGLDILNPRPENTEPAPRRAITEERFTLGSLRGILERKKAKPRRAFEEEFKDEPKEPRRAIEPGYKKIIDGARDTWDKARKGIGGLGEKLRSRMTTKRVIGATALTGAAALAFAPAMVTAPAARANAPETAPSATETTTVKKWGMFKTTPEATEATVSATPSAETESATPSATPSAKAESVTPTPTATTATSAPAPKYANSRRITKTTTLEVPASPGDGWSDVFETAAGQKGITNVDGYQIYKAAEPILPELVPSDDIYIRSAANSPQGLEYGVDGTDAVQFNDAKIQQLFDEYVRSQDQAKKAE